MQQEPDLRGAVSRRHFIAGSGAFLGGAALQAAQAPGTASSAAQDIARVVEDLVAANRICVDKEILDGYGHISARNPRDPSRFLMTRNLPPGLVTPDDLMEFLVETGEPADARGRGGVGERFIHSEILKARPEVNAVIHCHTLSMVLLGAIGETVRPIYHMAGFLGEGVPNFDKETELHDPDLLITDVAEGRALAGVLGNKPVALMRGHGAVVVGNSLPVAVGRAVYFQINCELQVEALKLNRPVKFLTAAEAKNASEAAWQSSGYPRNWEMWKQQSGRGLY
jgi:ribulose-5-phosphate 4-epimerase/fuculose-1-phosphate aldolase